MGAWVLIFYIFGATSYAGVSTSGTAEFTTRTACESARIEVQSRLGHRDGYTTAICVYKGDKK